MSARSSLAFAFALAFGLACSGPGAGTGATSESASATTEAATTGGSTDGVSSTGAASTADASTATTTSTGDATTTSTGDATTAGCSFLCLDGGGWPPVECGPWNPDCPEGEKCVPFANDGGGSWNANKCVPVARDPKLPGELCTAPLGGLAGLDDCDAESLCWHVNPETDMGYCAPFCGGSERACYYDPASCCEPGFACYISSVGVYALCLKLCSPLLQDCPGLDVCYPVGNAFECAPDVSGDMGSVGDPCEYINVCDPKTFCGDPAAFPGCDLQAGGCCIPFCDLNAPACPDKTVCTPWYDPMDVSPGYEHIGACVIPD